MHYNDTVLRRPNRLLESEKHHAYHPPDWFAFLSRPQSSQQTLVSDAVLASLQSAVSY